MYPINLFKYTFVASLSISLMLGTNVLAKERATNSANSHKIIKPKYIPALPNRKSNEGKHLFQSNGCTSCHSIDAKGGCLGPPLDGVGAYRSEEFIHARITKSASAIAEFERLYGQSELMPHPRIPTKEADNIVKYLLTLKPPKAGFYIGAHQNATPKISSQIKSLPNSAINGSAINEQKLIYDHGCTACHSINKIGGHFAPSFDGIANRRTQEYIYERISNAEFLAQSYPDEYQNKGNIMPPSNLSYKEIADITSFLMTLR